MKMYLCLFRVRLLNQLQYRSVLIGTILSGFCWAGMELMVYLAVYRSSNTALPMELSQTISYLWLQQIFLTLLNVVYSDQEIYEAIREGSIAYHRVRPMKLYSLWYFQVVANRISTASICCIPMIVVASILPRPYGLSLPESFVQAVLFLISLTVALGIVAAIAMLMFVSLFYTIAARGVKIIVTAVTTFLSGSLIPLPFFPKPVLKIVHMLPFSAMENTPFLIFTGNYQGITAIREILLQFFWLIMLVWIGQTAMKHALKKVIVQGG